MDQLETLLLISYMVFENYIYLQLYCLFLHSADRLLRADNRLEVSDVCFLMVDEKLKYGSTTLLWTLIKVAQEKEGQGHEMERNLALQKTAI